MVRFFYDKDECIVMQRKMDASIIPRSGKEKYWPTAN